MIKFIISVILAAIAIFIVTALLCIVCEAIARQIIKQLRNMDKVKEEDK